MVCGANTDPDGPVSATYTLARSAAEMRAALDEVVAAAQTVVCPGNQMSPGPWRRRTDLSRAAGTLFCGADGFSAVIAWTTDSDRLVSVVRADRAALDGLYRWWSSHS